MRHRHSPVANKSYIFKAVSRSSVSPPPSAESRGTAESPVSSNDLEAAREAAKKAHANLRTKQAIGDVTLGADADDDANDAGGVWRPKAAKERTGATKTVTHVGVKLKNDLAFELD